MDQETQDNYILARSKLWTPDLDKLLRKWKKQVEMMERGHKNLARKYTRRHYILGLPATVLSALISAGAFATFQECTDDNCHQSAGCHTQVAIRLTIGFIGIISVGLSASLTFLNYQETSEKHKKAADLFGERYRQIDSMLQIPGPLRGDPISTLQSIRSQYDNDIRTTPVLPKKYDTELSYNVIDSAKCQPESDVHTQTLNEALEEENKYDTDDDKDVCIAFDLDAIPNYNDTAAALAIAAITNKKREQEQESILKALAFELKRMENNSRDKSKMCTPKDKDVHIEIPNEN